MSYKYLPPHLHETANQAVEFLRNNLGVSNIKKEEALPFSLSYRPTLWGLSNDYYICVEVSETVYSNTLDSFIVECQSKALPIKLYIAVPMDIEDPNYRKNLESARTRRVGVIEIDNTNTPHISAEPLPFSLSALRPIEPKEYPKKYRSTITTAISTYINGNPSKGCSELYDEIEALSRKLAIKATKKGWWKDANIISGINFEDYPWGKICSLLINNLDLRKCTCQNLDYSLLDRIGGLTAHRNESGHRPKSRSTLLRRDRRLRTRFEDAADILLDFIEAVKPFRL